MTCTDPPNKDETALLLSRLQSQFGDLDIPALLSDDASNPLGNGDDDDDAGDVAPDDESESSLEEPSPEDLRAWQESQFRKGRMKLEAQRVLGEASGDAREIALRRRRAASRSAAEPESSRGREGEDEGREKVGFPSLTAPSIFFPKEVGSTSDSSLHPLLRDLAAADPEVLDGPWRDLFSSSRDGLSFATLLDRIRGYRGPTVMLVGGVPCPEKCLSRSNYGCDNDAGGDGARDNSDGERVALGFFTTDYWIESPDYFGTEDCFLFSLDYDRNEVRIIRPSSAGRTEANPAGSLERRKMMYCRPSDARGASRSTSAKKNGAADGICIGGSSANPRLHLTESLERCRALPRDSSFQPGDLLLSKCDDSLYYFNVDSLEVWGVGGQVWIEDALKEQRMEREVRERTMEKARRVDKRMLLEHFENGVHRDGGRGGIFGHRDLVVERDVDCRIGED